MNRRRVPALIAAAMALMLLLSGGHVAAQVQRVFPRDALRGMIVVVAAPEIQLNGTPVRLAPGARIRGADNMLALSASLTGYKLLVNYTLDGQGQVKDVWILTAAEAARQPWPTTPAQAQAWQFDAASQTWITP
jgi:hypothetical protein